MKSKLGRNTRDSFSCSHEISLFCNAFLQVQLYRNIENVFCEGNIEEGDSPVHFGISPPLYWCWSYILILILKLRDLHASALFTTHLCELYLKYKLNIKFNFNSRICFQMVKFLIYDLDCWLIVIKKEL